MLAPLLVASLVAGALALGWLGRLELLSQDLRYRLLPPSDPPPLLLVAIDDDSIKEAEVWPWPRGRYAQAIRILSRGGARAIFFDLDFSSPGPDPATDEEFALAAREAGNVALAMSLEERTTPEGFAVMSYALPLPALQEAAATVGCINFEYGPDGAVRLLPTGAAFEERTYPPLGVLMARAADPAAGLDGAPPGALLHIERESLNGLPVASFGALLRGEVPAEELAGKVVLIGPTATNLQDFSETPLGVVPGPYLHAAVMQTALARSWLAVSPRSTTLGLLGAASLLLALVMARLGWRGGAGALVLYLASVAGGTLLALRGGVMVEVVPLAVAGVLMYPVQLSLHARRTEETLKVTRRRTDALLRMSELENAEQAGQEPYLVPLVLLRQALGLSAVRVFTRGEKGWREETAEGASPAEEERRLLDETLDGGEVLRRRGEGKGRETLTIYVPLRTVRQGMGVLAAEGAPSALEEEQMRLLLSWATQTAYFLESRELARRMKEEETVRTNLARYLSPQVVEQVLADKVRIHLGGGRKVVTVLFSDIRDFTTITEGQPPERLVAILNEYFSEMAAIIFEHQGSLDKYIGDAMIAVFGSLVEVANPTQQALLTAVAMMNRMPELNRRWAERYGGFTMRMGIGINTGEVFLGNIGSEERMEFTVIGDTVNVASRFSGLAKAGQVLLTRAAADRVEAGTPLRDLPPSPVKGKSGLMEVYEVVYEEAT